MNMSKSLLSDINKCLREFESTIIYSDVGSGELKRKVNQSIKKLEKYKLLMDAEKTINSSKKELEVLSSDYYRLRCEQLTRQNTALERLLVQDRDLNHE